MVLGRKGLTWGFVAKLIIGLVALGILIYIVVKAGQRSGDIIQRIKDIF